MDHLKDDNCLNPANSQSQFRSPSDQHRKENAATSGQTEGQGVPHILLITKSWANSSFACKVSDQEKAKENYWK